jgi:hypothetical protein
MLQKEDEKKGFISQDVFIACWTVLQDRKTEIAQKKLRPGRCPPGIPKGQLEDGVVTDIVQEPQVARKSSDDPVTSLNNRNLTL